MSSSARTLLNSQAVQKYYEDQFSQNVHNKSSKNHPRSSQEGAGVFTDMLGGLIGNVASIVKAGSRLRKIKQKKKPKLPAKKLVKQRPKNMAKKPSFKMTGKGMKSIPSKQRGQGKKVKKNSSKSCQPKKRLRRSQTGKGDGRTTKRSRKILRI